jgi:hypothetical protein
LTVSATTVGAPFNGPYATDGSNKNFTFTFKAFTKAELQVEQVASGVTTIVNPALYSATINAGEGGTVVYTAAPAAGQQVYIRPNPAFTQQINWTNGGAFRAETFNEEADRGVLRDLVLLEGVNSSIRLPRGETAAVLPVATGRANKTPHFDGSGTLQLVTADQLVTGLTIPTTSATGTSVATRGALAGISSPIDGQIAWLFEGGRFGPFKFSTANLSAFVTADPMQGVYVAPASATSGASGAWVRQHNGILQAEWFGAVGDYNGVSGTDNLGAFNAITTFVNATGSIVAGRRGGYAVRFGLGRFYSSDVWDVKGSTFILEGLSVGQEGGRTSELIFAAGKGGLRFQEDTTQGASTGTTIPYGNDASIIRNLYLTGLGGAGTNAHGIWVRTRVEIDSVHVTGFAGDGVLINATAGGGGANEGNANNWSVRNCRLAGNGGTGLHVSGNDANAGYAIGNDCSFNGSWGVLDSAFLGNLYLGCHAAGNTAGPYWDAVGNSQFLNCYSESGQNPSVMSAGSICLGGLHAAGVTGTWLRQTFGTFKVQGGGMWIDKTDTAIETVIRIGDDPVGSKIYTAQITANSGTFWHGFGGKDAYFGWNQGGAVLFTGPDTTQQFGRGAAQVNIPVFLNGFSFGSYGPIWSRGGAAPGSGTHARSEIVWNDNATVGGAVGFIATAAGTPGTWSPFGIVGATQAASVALAAGATPTKAEFDALVTSLKNAKLMA